MYEYKVGQEIHVGVDVSGVIYNVNQTIVSIALENGATLYYHTDVLDRFQKEPFHDSFYAMVSDEHTSDMMEARKKAVEYQQLIERSLKLELELILTKSTYTDEGWKNLEGVFEFCYKLSKQLSAKDLLELVEVMETYHRETPEILFGIAGNMK